MRPRIKTGDFVGSTNKARLGLSRRFEIKVEYLERITGNVIIKTILRDKNN